MATDSTGAQQQVDKRIGQLVTLLQELMNEIGLLNEQCSRCIEAAGNVVLFVKGKDGKP